jgi:hypothetical protein
MRNASVVSFVLLCSSLSSLGQQKGSGTLQDPHLTDSVRAAVCPLQMRVRQGIGGNMMAVDKNGKQVEMFAARLIVLLSDVQREHQTQARMVEATVTVHGTTAKGQILPADTHQDASGEIAKTLTVRLTADGGPEVSGDIRLPGFTSTRMVDLESVAYDDGSTWKLSGTDTCRVPPDMVMPVGN